MINNEEQELLKSRGIFENELFDILEYSTNFKLEFNGNGIYRAVDLNNESQLSASTHVC